MVTTRSLCGMDSESILRKVVLPDPVPPEIRMFRRALTAAWMKSRIDWFSDPLRSRSSAESTSRRNFRIETLGPSSANGGMMAFTREPSFRRASTMADDSSIRRPTADTIRSIT